MQDVFKDLTVIELAGVLAGPSVGLFFAELGAKVIKIENPRTGGDVTRSWKLSTEDALDNTSAYYWSVNAGKEILFLDLADAKDLAQFYALVKTADIVISNYKAGDDKKLKVDYKTLSSIHPSLIHASINGFGKDKPRTAYDLILQAESGFMFMNGEPNAAPLKMPVALIDILAGHQLKEAVLIALLQRHKSGKGAALSVSLFDTAIASLANQATNWLIAHHLPVSQGSLHPNIAPYGELYTTADQHTITFAIGSDKQFQKLCALLGLGIATDVRYSNNQQRVIHREKLWAILSEKIRSHSFQDLYQACLELDIPI
ncbi:MAG: CaiB/BaiF CoA-transferase family protein, partial [Bacteroidia bacterium]|nr:CaiB/BaiF CoA-transferase family protein [Bacteroidia bacterium]